MVSAAKLVPLTKTTTLQLDLGDLRVTYRPRQIVEIQEQDRPEPEDDAEAQNQQVEQICRVVTAWDLAGPLPTEDVGIHAMGSVWPSDTEPVPLEPRFVRFLDFGLRSQIITAITLDAAPDPTKMAKRLQRRGSNGTSTSSNGRRDEPSLYPSGSTTS
jgi:hypothetical protein